MLPVLAWIASLLRCKVRSCLVSHCLSGASGTLKDVGIFVADPQELARGQKLFLAVVNEAFLA